MANLSADGWCGVLAELERAVAVGVHHGRPGLSAAAKLTFAARLAAGPPETLSLDQLDRLVRHPQATVRQVAAQVMGRLAPTATITAFWRRLAEDDDWEVREWAVGPLTVWAQRDPDGGRARLSGHLGAPSARERRAALLALRVLVVRQGLPVADAWDLLEPLWADEDPYIRESLGSFVVADACLAREPEVVLARLEARSVPWPPEALHHLARMVTARAAAPHQARLARLAAAAVGSGRPPVRLARWLTRVRATGTP